MTKQITETNEFGETHTQTQSDAQALSYINSLPAKAGITAITAIATANAPVQGVAYVQADVQAIATLANANKAKINEILAALKVVS